MANPFDIPYVVSEDESPLTYNRRCYYAGETIQVKQNDLVCFLETVLPEQEKDCCFPEYCVTDSGTPYAGYRVPFTIPVGDVLVLPVPQIEGCKPPGSVRFFYCSSCVYAAIDSDPIVDPTDPVAMTGGGAYPNPTMFDLNGCEETIHLVSGDSAPVDGMLMFYC